MSDSVTKAMKWLALRDRLRKRRERTAEQALLRHWKDTPGLPGGRKGACDALLSLLLEKGAPHELLDRVSEVLEPWALGDDDDPAN